MENPSTITADTTENVLQEETIQKTEKSGEQIDAEPAASMAADETNDELAYTKRDDFTSEIYKVEIRELGYFGIGDVKKILKKLNLEASKIKAPSRRGICYVCFRSKEDQERAISTLNGYKWKAKVLKATIAKPSPDPLMSKRNLRKLLFEPECSEPKKKKTLEDSICPLSSMPYDEQLKQKSKKIEMILNEFTYKLKHTNTDLKKHMASFKYLGLEPSSQINGYRNKCELTVGRNAEKETVVGFRMGTYASGSVEVSEIEALPHIPDQVKWAAKTYQKFVRSKGDKFLPFNPEDNSGHFRQLCVRVSAHNGDIMLITGLFSTNFKLPELDELKQEIKAFWENENSEFKCSSLYYQDLKNRDAGGFDCPVEHLSGAKHLTERICDLEFSINPVSFFQVNSKMAQTLYQKTIELAAPKPHSTVLDICCGTGTIALCFAKHCKQVLGVEIIPQAIKDAEFNATLNNIKNCKFFTGNASDYIQSMVREVVYGNAPGEPLDLIAVVDPPRSGLNNRSIAAIRGASAIKRLIYISCCPERAQKNWNELGCQESKQYKGNPFYPKTAIALDLFPHTPHTELIVLFERVESDEDKQTDEKLIPDAKDDDAQ